jgi:hypothetical protein
MRGLIIWSLPMLKKMAVQEGHSLSRCSFHLTVRTNLTVKSSVSAESIPRNGPIDKQIDNYPDQRLLWLPLFKVN